MITLLKKELKLLFSNITGLVGLGLFLIISWLFFWFLKGDLNIFSVGFSDVSPFFQFAPWLFCVLIPALGMFVFTEEYRLGTWVVLRTKSVSVFQIFTTKILAQFLFLSLGLLCTLVYVYSIFTLSTGIVDIGVISLSYVALLFIALCFICITAFLAAFFKQPMVVFLLSMFFCLVFFYGFQYLSETTLLTKYPLEFLGFYEHYQSLQKGLLYPQDIFYFFTVIVFFSGLTLFKMGAFPTNFPKLTVYFLLCFFGGYLLTTFLPKRIDCTAQKKHTLAPAIEQWLQKIERPLLVNVYLSGALPPRFKRLQRETRYFLSGLKNINPLIEFRFIPPQKMKDPLKKRLRPTRLTIKESAGVFKQVTIFPWAVLRHKKNELDVPLLKEVIAGDTDQISASIDALPYVILRVIRSLAVKKTKKIAVLKGNENMKDLDQYDFLKTLAQQYRLAPFALQAVKKEPQKTLKQLKNFDLAIVAKPQKSFTESEKYTLDQYAMNGGRLLWMLDLVHTNIDSLFNVGQTLAYPTDLNLTDLLFRYGVRMGYDLVKDLYASKIALATGNTGTRTNYQSFPWVYHPAVRPDENHSITKSLSPVKLQFASTIELLKSPTKKTILLGSSDVSKRMQVPNFITLKSIGENPNAQTFNSGQQVLGVLLEGDFVSGYKDRIPPFMAQNPKQNGKTKMVVISDGDISRNQVHKGKPIPLGFDKWTQEFYDNKAFLENTVAYLLDDTNLLHLRSKNTAPPLLNKDKIQQEGDFWRWFNLILPLGFLLVFTACIAVYRKWQLRRVEVKTYF